MASPGSPARILPCLKRKIRDCSQSNIKVFVILDPSAYGFGNAPVRETLRRSSQNPISTQSSSAHVEERDQELWGTLEQGLSLIGFSKNNKSVSDWSIQVLARAVERAACLACERVFP